MILGQDPCLDPSGAGGSKVIHRGLQEHEAKPEPLERGRDLQTDGLSWNIPPIADFSD
jgi:hypothetical protein